MRRRQDYCTVSDAPSHNENQAVEWNYYPTTSTLAYLEQNFL
jgi:hypothetical protein